MRRPGAQECVVALLEACMCGFCKRRYCKLLGFAHTYKQDQTLTFGYLHSPVVDCKNSGSERVAMKLLLNSSTTFV